jgi:type II secretory pathway component PulF
MIDFIGEHVVALVLILLALQVWGFICFVVVNYWMGLLRRAFSLLVLEHLYALAKLGLPLTRGMRYCAEGTLSRTSREDLRAVERGLDQGMLVGDALAHVPEGGLLRHSSRLVAPSTAARLVSPAEAEVLRVGEMSGNLAQAVQFVITERRRHSSIRASLLAASFYPLALILAISFVATGLTMFIVPKFKKMFDELNVELPFLTRTLIGFTDVVGAHWYWFLMLLMMMGLSTVVTAGIVAPRLRARARHDWRWGEPFERFIDRVPFVHRPLRRAQLAEFCHEMAMLLRVGTPTHRALRVIAEGTLSPWLRERATVAANAAEAGRGLGEALDAAGLDHRAAWFGHAFADREDMADALARLGDDYAERISWTAALVTRLLPPLVVLVLGTCVAWVVIALFLPLLKLIMSVG